MSLTLADKVVYEEEIQKSRFIAKAAPVASEEEALAFLAENREPEATHNGHAYKIGLLYRFSDDGEPSGTAGRPILHAIEAQGLDRVAVLVVLVVVVPVADLVVAVTVNAVRQRRSHVLVVVKTSMKCCHRQPRRIRRATHQFLKVLSLSNVVPRRKSLHQS